MSIAFNRRQVNLENVCPMCGKADYCYWLLDGAYDLLVCGRTTEAKDTVVCGGDGINYIVIKPQTQNGYCIYAPHEDVMREKQRRYEEWCVLNGVVPKEKYSALIGTGVAASPVERVSQRPKPSDEELSSPIAEPERLHEVYSKLLQLCVLEKHDEEALKSEWKEYFQRVREKHTLVTLPPMDKLVYKLKGKHKRFSGLKNASRKRIVQQLVEAVGEPYGVPGFYTYQYDGKQYWDLAGDGGIVFPSYDMKGRIIRLRIKSAFPVCQGNFNGMEGEFSLNSYKGVWEFTSKGAKERVVVYDIDNNIKDIELTDSFLPINTKVKGKYKNFSSFRAVCKEGVWCNSYQNGTRSGSMPSIYMSPENDMTVVYFTEGEKKAMIANLLLDAPVVDFPGVGFYSQMVTLNADNFDSTEEGKCIIDVMMEMGCSLAIICYDADKETNKSVLRKEQEAVQQFIEKGLYVAIGDWCSAYGKGLDDIVLAGLRPNINLIDVQF